MNTKYDFEKNYQLTVKDMDEHFFDSLNEVVDFLIDSKISSNFFVFSTIDNFNYTTMVSNMIKKRRGK